MSYLSSDMEDPGLHISSEQLNQFFIGDGHVRNWVFENIRSPVFIMTTPDLGRYQLKRSKHSVHYVYVQHSLVSLHMAYRDGAFSFYDTVFCCGPHHLEEMKSIRALEGRPDADYWEVGYSRIDELLEIRKRASYKLGYKNGETHYLLAPSWGAGCLIESGVAESLIAKVLESGKEITLRPHPQTLRLAPATVRRIELRFSNHPSFRLDTNPSSFQSLLMSDCMITDWSGVALEYALALLKPIIFIEAPRKINNERYHLVSREPVEVALREKLGHVLEDITDVTNPRYLSVKRERLRRLMEHFIYNSGSSDRLAAGRLVDLLDLPADAAE